MEGRAPSEIVVLKSVPYGEPEPGRALPYRIDLLPREAQRLVWIDLDAGEGRTDRLLRRAEAAIVPFRQAWATRGRRRGAAATVAMFESEGHGLALARLLTGRRRPPLVIVACWLADLVVASPRRARLYRWLYRSVDAVVVFSGNQVATLSARLGLPPGRVHVVRFGVDLDELAGVPVSDRGDVVAVGRDLGRDWATLLRACAGTDWQVELVTRALQLEGLEVPPQVRTHGRLDRAAYLELLAGAGVVVVPTEVREYPTGQTVLLEAMSLGKACVVTDTPAMREYVTDGVTAVLVPPHDPAALRSAVDALLADDERRTSIGAAARDHEAVHGGAARMWASIATVLEGAVAAAGSR